MPETNTLNSDTSIFIKPSTCQVDIGKITYNIDNTLTSHTRKRVVVVIDVACCCSMIAEDEEIEIVYSKRLQVFRVVVLSDSLKLLLTVLILGL